MERLLGESRWLLSRSVILETRDHIADGSDGAAARRIEELEAEVRTLREDRVRFELVARAATDTVWDWNFADDAVWWSDSLTTVFGHERWEMPAGIESWSMHIHPDDRPRVVLGIHDVINSGGSTWSDEYRFQRRDGTWATVHDRAFILRDIHGQPYRMAGGMKDITEKYAAAHRIRQQAALLDEARDAIIVRDLHDVITFWNHGAEALYGWSREEAVGCAWHDLGAANDERDAESMLDLFARGHWSGEMTQAARDGRTVIVEVRRTLLRDDAGVPGSVLSIETDITDRKALERQSLRAQRLESIGTLAGGIAHDLNNMFTPILMCVEILKSCGTSSDYDEIIETVDTCARRGAEMVRQVLSFARGVDGKQALVEPLDLLRDLSRILAETFPKSISLRVHEESTTWALKADRTQLHQVLVNLCVNARDAMPSGGTLTVAATNVVLDAEDLVQIPDARPGPYVCLIVSDTGTGMSEEVRERIFEPFFTTKDIGKGTGLGLSTAIAIVKGHNGFIQLFSEPGKGTTFKVYLPASVDVEQPFEHAEGAPPAMGNGELVLLVDDEQSIREIVGQVLADSGFQVITAADGAEAVALFAQSAREVAVVFTDIAMPIMDGTSMIRALRRIDPNVAVVAASGLAAPSEFDGEGALAGVSFLPKPFTVRQVLEALGAALRERVHCEERPQEATRAS